LLVGTAGVGAGTAGAHVLVVMLVALLTS